MLNFVILIVKNYWMKNLVTYRDGYLIAKIQRYSIF